MILYPRYFRIGEHFTVMNQLKYSTTLKASGKEYERIVFWNRFLRNPIELVLSWTPAVISIILMYLGYITYFTAIIYAACWVYPIYIFAFQFKSSVAYHLKHREPSEDAPCTISLTTDCIIADIPSFETVHTYRWSEFTKIYKKLGYYMLFNQSKMVVMLRIADMSDAQKQSIPEYIKSHVDMNKCKVLF